jgi:hypothetical protein
MDATNVLEVLVAAFVGGCLVGLAVVLLSVLR